MSARFPSRYELKIAGCSLICAQFLLVLLGIIYAIIDPQDYDASIYSARTDEDVVKLHEVLSSEDIRTSTEISAAIWWMSFPFYLIALYVIKKLFMSFFIGTKVEMWIYVMEKAYLFAILITNIIGPALSLTVVSFEWSIHEYTPDTEDYVPTGYYIQLYSLVLTEEIYDAVCISTEISAAIWWMSFPFYLIAIYVIKKLFLSLFVNTKVEMWIYVMEKAYLFAVLMTNIIGPALSLTVVSFEWSIHEYTPDTEDYIPTGYYIQLYSLVLTEEIYDAVCIADGVFLFLLCLIPQFKYFSNNPKFNVLKKGPCFRKCRHLMMVLVALSIAISYSISLFRFADSGFFSLNGGAGWIPIYGFILKFFLGFMLWHIGIAEARYAELQRVFGDKSALKDDAGGSGDDVGAHG
eukprot:182444_1